MNTVDMDAIFEEIEPRQRLHTDKDGGMEGKIGECVIEEEINLVQDNLCQPHEESTIEINPRATVSRSSGDGSVKGEDRQHIETKTGQPLPTKVYRRRWLIVFIFCLYSLVNAFQWIEYSSISNIIREYYQTKHVAVDWLSMVIMVVYVPLIFPVTWLLDKMGLRVIALLAASLDCLGAWLKTASVRRHLFGVTALGQFVCAVANVFILGMPSRVAGLWFGPQEVSTACSICVFGNQLGVALGFLVPPLVVPNSGDMNQVGERLSMLFYGVAAITSVLFLLVFLFFKEKPALPPSPAQAVVWFNRPDEDYSYLRSIRRLTNNPNFIMLTITYGIITAVFYSISTLLNRMIVEQYAGEEVSAGKIGLTLVLVGMIGSVICGFWLDRTKTFKQTTLVMYGISLLSMILFTFTLSLGHLWVVFLTAACLGFFVAGYIPVGFEFAVELTFPESESTSSGILNASAQAFGVIFILVQGHLMSDYNALAGNLFLCTSLLLGSIMTGFIKSDLRRQKAHEDAIKRQPMKMASDDTLENEEK
uniref:heme transporter FLVCR2-like n=1 Tax=Myxine glutinosa TaxID=7769 RepID=UPI00358EEE42